MDSSIILEKMKKHFPRWMEIRRKTKSNGINILKPVANEISEIYDAIEQYRKDFFIDNYEGREDDILTFLYRANIGNVDYSKIEIINPQNNITEDKDVFFSKDEYFYFKAPYLYLKKEIDEIEYSIAGYKYSTKTEKFHVWNIFDEFAIFVNIRRYENETNKELLNRILKIGNIQPNSSKEKLKEAIVANLSNIDKDLSIKDIDIERTTPDNLLEYYNEYETILDDLAKINRDTYQNKKWDIDKLIYNFQKIDYIPHAWDVLLASYINGVGSKDDLKVSIINSDEATDANIYFYKKNIESIEKYIKNKNIKKDIVLDLSKYNSYLAPENVTYETLASPIKKIDPENILFNVYYDQDEVMNRSIEDLIDYENFQPEFFDIIDNSVLDKNSKYKITFHQNEKYDEFRISDFHLKNKDNNKYKNLINEKVFGFNNNGYEVTDEKTKKNINSLNDLDSYDNAKKTDKGIEIYNLTKSCELQTIIDKSKDEYMFIDFKREEIPILDQFLEFNNCFYRDGVIISDNTTEDKTINIKIKANFLKFDICGPFFIEYNVDGEKQIPIQNKDNDEKNVITKEYLEPKNFDLKLTLLPFPHKKTEVRKITYNNYILKIKNNDKKMDISDLKNIKLQNDINNINITMQSFTGFSPVISKIYVGEPVKDSIYTTTFETDDEFYILNFETSSFVDVTLQKIDKNNVTVESKHNYIPKKTFTSLYNNSVIKLDLSEYLYINEISVNGAQLISNYGNDFNISTYIKLNKGESISIVKIKGSFEKICFKNNLKNILSKKTKISNNTEFYITELTRDIIVKNENTYEYIPIYKEDISTQKNITKTEVLTTDKFKIGIVDKNFALVFKNVIANNFKQIFFIPNDSQIYKTINDYKMILNESDDISISSIFDKILNLEDTNYFYMVNSLNKNYKVLLCCKDVEENSLINPTHIKIKSLYSVTDNPNLKSEKLSLSIKSILGNNIQLNKEYVTSNNILIDLAKYNINNNDFEIVYSKKNNDNYLDFYYIDRFKIDSSFFNKLTYCNIDCIDSIYIDDNEIKLEKDIDYILKEKEGIIYWTNDKFIKKGTLVSIGYFYKKPVAIKYDVNTLYEKIEYDINSYEMIGKIKLSNIKNNDKINLNEFSQYKDSDTVSVSCTKVGFKAEVINEYIYFKVYEKDNKKIAVKTGYYYYDGLEYYLFANKNVEEKEDNNLTLYDVKKVDQCLHLNKSGSNFIRNSRMSTTLKNNIFNINMKSRDIDGVSSLKNITTCDTYNYWTTYGMNVSIQEALNGNGIYFEPNSESLSKHAYAYLDISRYLKENCEYVISLYAVGDFELYLGECTTKNDTFNRDGNIELINGFQMILSRKNIYNANIINSENKKYYIVVKGNVLLDDIIIQKAEVFEEDCHSKNVDILNYNIDEGIYSDYVYRINLDDSEGAVFYGTEKNNDNEIFNSSFISWGYTNKKSFSKEDDFKNFSLKNVYMEKHNNDIALFSNQYKIGEIVTSAVYVGKSINNIIVKVNDILSKEMSNFTKITLLSSDTDYGVFNEVASVENDNILDLNEKTVLQYVKIKIVMPTNKIINKIDLFVEYKEEEKESIGKQSVFNGEYLSKVFDSMYVSKYKVDVIDFDLVNTGIDSFEFFIRGTKTNSKNTVWTEWKNIEVDENHNIINEIYFNDYRYFQFKVKLKGENSAIIINNLDLKVI